MAVIVAGAAAGAFGDGVLSDTKTSAGGLAVQYPRLGRAQAPLDLEIEWPDAAPDAALWFSREYADRFAIEKVQPAPVAVAIDADRVIYTFRTQGAGGRVAARFTLRPKSVGAVRGRLGLEGGPAVAMRQWVFP